MRVLAQKTDVKPMMIMMMMMTVMIKTMMIMVDDNVITY
jgi:hypothetical protein